MFGRRKDDNTYVDIHCHLLPGVDDGSKSLDMTRTMLQQAYEEGIRAIIATPHYHYKRGHAPIDELARQLKLVRQEAHKIDPKFEIYSGNEIFFSSNAVEKVKNHEVFTMAGSKYVLVEFSPSDSFSTIKQALYSFQVEDYYPIIAHIERYACMTDDWDNADELYDMGIYIQVNAGSIVGGGGKEVKKFTKYLLDNDMIHFVATDAHNCDSRRIEIQTCKKYIAKKYGDAQAIQCMYENPMRIIRQEVI